MRSIVAATIIFISSWFINSFTSLLMAQDSQREFVVQDRHVLLIYPGVDSLQMNYLFSVENPNNKAVEVSIPVLKIARMQKFFPTENVTDEDISLSPTVEGQLIIKKNLDPGKHLLGLGYVIGAQYGSTVLEMTAPVPIKNLILLAPPHDLKFKADDERKMQFHDIVTIGQRRYQEYRISDLDAGEKVIIKVEGIAEGRKRFWILGFVFLVVLLLAALSLAWFTRPQRDMIEKVAL